MSLIGPCATVPESWLSNYGKEHPLETLNTFATSFGHPSNNGSLKNCCFYFNDDQNDPLARGIYKWSEKGPSQILFPGENHELPERGFLHGAVQDSISTINVSTLLNENFHYNILIPQQLLMAAYLHFWNTEFEHPERKTKSNKPRTRRNKRGATEKTYTLLLDTLHSCILLS
jgi:hypothetical protein